MESSVSDKAGLNPTALLKRGFTTNVFRKISRNFKLVLAHSD